MMQKVRGAGLFVYVWVLFREKGWKVPRKERKKEGKVGNRGTFLGKCMESTQGREKKCGEGRK